MWWPIQAMIVLGMWKEILADLYKPATYIWRKPKDGQWEKWK